MARETNRARSAYDSLLLLGPGASLNDLLNHFQKLAAEQPSFKPPTRHLSQLKQWSRAFDWQTRREEHFRLEAEQSAERQRIRREQALETEDALDYVRVESLKELAALLKHDLTHGRLWLHEFKQLGSGPHAMLVDIEKPNTALIEQYRGILDDIAKETGGRKSPDKIDITLIIRREAERLGLDPDEAIEAAKEIVRQHAGQAG